MLALINRVWHPLTARARQEPTAEASISFTIPCYDLPALRELLAVAPGLRLKTQGSAAISCRVEGSAEAIAAFGPKLQAWQYDCEADAAW